MFSFLILLDYILSATWVFLALLGGFVQYVKSKGRQFPKSGFIEQKRVRKYFINKNKQGEETPILINAETPTRYGANNVCWQWMSHMLQAVNARSKKLFALTCWENHNCVRLVTSGWLSFEERDWALEMRRHAEGAGRFQAISHASVLLVSNLFSTETQGITENLPYNWIWQIVWQRVFDFTD